MNNKAIDRPCANQLEINLLKTGKIISCDFDQKTSGIKKLSPVKGWTVTLRNIFLIILLIPTDQGEKICRNFSKSFSKLL